MAAPLNRKDNSRTSQGKTYNLVRQHTKPPEDEGGWQWMTRELLESVAFRTLSTNSSRVLFRLIIENISHGSLHNGKLVVTHEQFIDYGVTGEYVADAIDELEFKGLIRARRGRAGVGTSHPNIFRLTWLGDFEGAKATNDWKRCTGERAKEWSSSVRAQMQAKRARVGRKSKSSLRNPEIPPLRNPEIRRAS